MIKEEVTGVSLIFNYSVRGPKVSLFCYIEILYCFKALVFTSFGIYDIMIESFIRSLHCNCDGHNFRV